MKKSPPFFISFILAVMLCVSAETQAQDPALLIDSALDRVERAQIFNALSDAVHSAPERMVKEIVDVLDVKDEPLETVLEKITAQTGVVFIVPEPLRGRSSLFIEQVNIWDLLKILLQAHDLAYYQTSGAVHIMRKDIFHQRYGYEFSSSMPSRIIPVRYANMEVLVPLVKVNKSKEGQAWMDTKNRQVILIDTPEKLQEIRSLVADHDLHLITREFYLQYVSFEMIRDGLNRLLTKDIGRAEYRADEQKIIVTDAEPKLNAVAVFLDEKDKKITIPFRAKIIRVSLSEEHARGIDWEAIVSDYQAAVLVSGDEAAQVSEQICIGTVTKEDYEILIEALDTVGDLTHLIAFDFEPVLNKESSLDFDTNDPFWSLRPGVRRGQDGPVLLDPGGFEMKTSLMLKKNGGLLNLEILPRLHWMDYADMGDDYKRHVFTGQKKIKVDFARKDVIVIGGLIRTEEILRTRKFPFLGDLPVVGSVFRMERRRYANTEYVVFLIPEQE